MTQAESIESRLRILEKKITGGLSWGFLLFHFSGNYLTQLLVESTGGGRWDQFLCGLASWGYLIYHHEAARLALRAWLLAP